MTLAEQTYQALRRDILDGVFEPGRPLRLDALKARYGAGFSPLREALNRLQAERLVTAAPLRGFSVAPLSAAAMWDAIETRILIETDALRRSIARGGDDWEAAVVAALHALRLQSGRGDPEALEARHLAFHMALIGASDSVWLTDFATQLYAATERYRRPALARIGSARDLQAEHGVLADAALARDADTACARLSEHYRDTGRAVERALAA
ncbi:MAG: GntR family transcriptional regulator [Gemmobacter sp.]